MIVMTLAMTLLMTMTDNAGKMVDRNADMMRTLIERGWDSD